LRERRTAWTSFETNSPIWLSISPGSWCDFDVAGKTAEANRLEALASDGEFWNDPAQAQATMRQLARLRGTVERWQGMSERASTTHEFLGLAIESSDRDMLDALAPDGEALLLEAEEREFELVLSGEFDARSAILAIHAGAGGTDSQDWAEMLFRMYTRWAERAGFKAEVLDLSEGEEAGIKSVTIEITGEHAYGYAKAERGVHRLVRLSPFDSAHTRHTSFALVEVLPESEGDVDVQINPDDLKIDVFKASGAGGQHVQKNSTAIRITHRPSGLVVTCQNERSQLQNKEVALRILRSRLMEIAIRERLEERAKLKGDHIAAGWGNQIRSYVLHPYKMVKDHRSGFESTNPELVLDGELKPLMKAYLLSSVEGE
jgi:peptide chain release factor 2